MRMVKQLRAVRRRERLLLEYKCAVTIKRYLRGHVARVRYHSLLRRRAEGAFVVTRFFQHLYPRMQLWHSRPARQARNRGITRFQAIHRGYLVRSLYQRQQRAALLVSRTFKGYEGCMFAVSAFHSLSHPNKLVDYMQCALPELWCASVFACGMHPLLTFRGHGGVHKGETLLRVDAVCARHSPASHSVFGEVTLFASGTSTSVTGVVQQRRECRKGASPHSTELCISMS